MSKRILLKSRNGLLNFKVLIIKFKKLNTRIMIFPPQGQSPNPSININGGVFSHNQLGRGRPWPKVCSATPKACNKLWKPQLALDLLLSPPKKFRVIYKFHSFCHYRLLFGKSTSHIESNVCSPTNKGLFRTKTSCV